MVVGLPGRKIHIFPCKYHQNGISLQEILNELITASSFFTIGILLPPELLGVIPLVSPDIAAQLLQTLMPEKATNSASCPNSGRALK